MSDEELVNRLRYAERRAKKDSLLELLFIDAADYIEHCHASQAVMAQEIERLTQERDEAQEWRWSLGEQLQKEIMLTNTLMRERDDAHARAEAAERKVEVLREALTKLLARDERNTCQHDETHRGGVLWEICDSCGAQWADDEGGKPEWKDPSEWTAARAALAETEMKND